MEDVIADILAALRKQPTLSAAELDRIVRKHSKRAGDGRRIFAKKHILPYYLDVRDHRPHEFAAWNVDADLDRRFVATLKMKPRRTASGVATITVLTQPWTCSSDCIYCPRDVRMPKSYLHDEPACQRAERNWFDPYLQVAVRLHTLQQMGHATDKIELIVLGGTWSDYPRSYQLWFVHGLFAALNASDDERAAAREDREQRYRRAGIPCEAPDIARSAASLQDAVDAGTRSFNDVQRARYVPGTSWHRLAQEQTATLADVLEAQSANEDAEHRVVGLVIETRPDLATAPALRFMRQLGCTKVQLGVQSIDGGVLALNGRSGSADDVSQALQRARLFGFKTHAHFMVNLLGASPDADKRDYELFANDAAFAPDEVKLYPCALVAGTGLVACYEEGTWHPYTEEELVDVLASALLSTPPQCRVSRMIRDISARDILAGNKKTNLRQIVEQAVEPQADRVREIRYREIGTDDLDVDALELDVVRYPTLATEEFFLQWVTPRNKVAGFLRLSLPHADALEELGDDAPVRPGEAMIREVHVYGTASALGAQDGTSQHRGLGRQLVERACALAREHGYGAVNVISAIGTRNYYRSLGFEDNGLYQRRPL